MSPLSLAAALAIASQCAPLVAPETMLSVAMTESRLNPVSIHDNTTGRSFAPPGTTEAIGFSAHLLDQGHDLDLGLMQVNSQNLQRLGLSLPAAFDPCLSMRAGARLLIAAYRGGADEAAQQAALRASLSTYNTGDPQRGLANGYVRRIETAAEHVVPAIHAAVAVSRHDGDGAASAQAAPATVPGWDVWAQADTARQEAQWDAPAPASAAAAEMPPAGNGAPAPAASSRTEKEPF